MIRNFKSNSCFTERVRINNMKFFFILVLFSLVSLEGYAEYVTNSTGWNKDVCAQTPSEPSCNPACGTRCSYRVCTATTDSGNIITNKNSKSLPFEFNLPLDSCVRPGQTVTINSIPINLENYPYFRWSSTAIAHPTDITYAKCVSVPIFGPICPPAPTKCPLGMTLISSGSNSGKCSTPCNPTTGDISLSNTDGSDVNLIKGGCRDQCTPTSHCANYVQCVYKNLCNSPSPSYLGLCGTLGSGTLGCGASVTFASCPLTEQHGETTVACTFVPADVPDPLAAADFSRFIAPSMIACGSALPACTGAGTSCSSCAFGYHLTGTTCMAASLTACTGAGTSCASCAFGYYLTGTTCTAASLIACTVTDRIDGECSADCSNAVWTSYEFREKNKYLFALKILLGNVAGAIPPQVDETEKPDPTGCSVVRSYGTATGTVPLTYPTTCDSASSPNLAGCGKTCSRVSLCPVPTSGGIYGPPSVIRSY